MNSSLESFRHVWKEEICKDKPTQSNCRPNSPSSPTDALCQIGANCKYQTSTAPLVPASVPFPSAANTTCAFTIGIGTFTTFNAASSSSSSSSSVPLEPPSKKQKISTRTLLDELIHDIDESTDVPFFNISLPREIALKIFDCLSIRDLYACLQVCRAWNSLSSDELLWSNIHKQLTMDNPTPKADQSWKDYVRETILHHRKLVENFKTHQCQTVKLTNHLGVVLTCANSNDTTIVAGYSAGIIRTWSIESVLQTNEDDEEQQLNTPEIIYESLNGIEPSAVQSVGFLRNDIYAVHDDGLLEIWKKDQGDQPYFTHQLEHRSVGSVANDDEYLCLASPSKFHVWNVQESIEPAAQELNFLTEFNDRILSMCMSSAHSTPIAIVAGRKSLWCLSLKDLSNRLSFYPVLQTSAYSRKILLDIHDHEPLAVTGIENEIKLFDLQKGRCNILSTNYKNLPSSVDLIRANHCPQHEFLVAYQNAQISIFDLRQKNGAIQHFYNHHSTITTLQADTWKLASTDAQGYVRLWDRRMHPHSLWHINPYPHPVRYCTFDQEKLICALIPLSKHPEMMEYTLYPDAYSGHLYVCNFNSDVSTQLDEDLKICTSSYDAPKASHQRIGLHTPYDIIL